MQNATIYNIPNALDTAYLNETSLRAFLSNCYRIIPIEPLGHYAQLDKFGRLSEVFKVQWLQFYDFFFDVILVGSILLAGMTGNILSCLVLLRDRSHGTTSLILTSLAICDTLFLIGCLFFQFLRTLSYYTLWMDYMNLYAHISKILYGSGMAARMTRNWMVVLVSMERWVAVCKPLHAPSICTRKKARLSIYIVASFCILYNIPNFFIVDAIKLYCTGNDTLPQLDGTLNVSISELPSGVLIYHSSLRQWVRNNYLFRLIYRLIGYTILIVILPNVIICVLNVLLIRGIKYANARRAQIMARVDCVNRRQFDKCSTYSALHPDSGQGGGGQRGSGNPESHAYFVRVEKSTRSRTGEVNRLCVGVIVIYLICELPAVGYQVIHLLQHRGAIELAKPVTNALVCLNSGVNFFVYVFLGRRFRSQLKVLLRPLFCGVCRSGDDEADHGHVVNSQAHHHNSYGQMAGLSTGAKMARNTFPLENRSCRRVSSSNRFSRNCGHSNNEGDSTTQQRARNGCGGRLCQSKRKIRQPLPSMIQTTLTEI